MTAFLLDCSIKVSVVLGIALIALRLLRGQSAAVRHCVLSVAVLCAALMPVFNLVLPPLEVKVEREVQAPAVPQVQQLLPDSEVEFEDAFSAPVLNSGAARPLPPAASFSARRFSWKDAVLNVWFAGVLVGFAVLGVGILRLAWIACGSSPIQTGRWVRLAKHVAHDYGLRKPLRLRRSSRRSILATWGFLRPEVILPADSVEWPEERVEIVLSHEFAHVRRGDWLFQVLAAMVRAFHWFNPLVWVVCRRLEVECEQACDDAVVRRGFSPAQYATHLLELAKAFKSKNRELAPALSMARRSTLDQRFRALLAMDLNRNSGTSTSIAATVLVFAAVSLPVAALRASTQTFVVTQPAAVSQVSPSPGTVLNPSGAAVTALPAQNLPLPPGMASLEGAVFRADNGAPVTGATVELQLAGQHPPDTNSYETTTDFQGKFVFPAVKPSAYRLVASTYASGYVTTALGKNSANPRGLTLDIAAGQRLNDVKIAMTPTGSITGRIIDGDGEPVARAHVMALRTAYRDGKKVLKLVQSVPANDLGEYRLFWLPPGNYYVTAKPETPERNSSTSIVTLPGVETTFELSTDPTIIRRPLEGGGMAEDVYVPVFYPGSIDVRNAKTIEVRPGENLGGLQINVAAGKLPSRHLRGTVINAATGRPAPYTRITLTSPNPSDISFVPNALTDNNGRFDVAGVAPGRYFLTATLFVPNPNRAGALNTDTSAGPAFLPIEVGDSDVEDLRIVVGPFITLTGRIIIEGRGPEDPDLARLRLTNNRQLSLGPRILMGPLVPAPPPQGNANISMILYAGQYEFSITGLTPNMYIKSLRLGSIDLLAGPILLSSQPQEQVQAIIGIDASTVTGKVLDARRAPAAGATVVLVPNAPRRERRDLYRVISSDSSGNFEFQSIEPGGYKVFAWGDVDPGIWLDPDFMQAQESRGSAVQVNSAARASTEVTVIPR
jgi:beta-lactamase regulating signal transducer with metallopeptidase domain/protocatechuate 3,4-dioxygenase beta subunit